MFIPNKRVCYEGMKGSGSRFPSALIGYNLSKLKGLKGVCLMFAEPEEEEMNYGK